MSADFVRDPRVGKHRYRPHGQAPALRGARAHGRRRHRPDLGRARPGPRGRARRLSRRRRLGRRPPRAGEDRLRGDLCRCASGERAQVARGRVDLDRPHSRQARSRRRAGREPRSAPGRTRRQPRQLRRAGHHPDRRRRQPSLPGSLRRDRRDDREQVRRPGNAAEHRRVHENDGQAGSRRSAAPSEGRRSSSSIPQTRRS